ncbi:hypothetical protein MmTuc01_1925 [Methanosarcina mazei Tuc01]|uniref:Uncharacterized protein n=1 Tax=Methanosarcina mazei Tuc01 TaxID=1236903 RepID=M1QJV8_METMZ|nr:hypothetical protein MmTuc01_1925 [Methanosarcina mazei Tuc01]
MQESFAVTEGSLHASLALNILFMLMFFSKVIILFSKVIIQPVF